ncbi:AraC family transcriptional regulator [Acetobacteraceae bacterium H6797]|nr:AraC family transcriptional regulator [Acetobacteraceae bacterium H6797]
MDPLSDVLSLLKPRNSMSAGFDVGGDWRIDFPDQAGTIKCGALVSGHCLLTVEGVPGVVRLGPGDGFLLPRGLPFTLANDLAVPGVKASAVFSVARRGGIVTHQGGGGCFLLSSRFALEGHHAGILLGALPPIVHLKEGALRWAVERMMQELRSPQPGSFLLLQHLAHMILLDGLRQHVAAGAAEGWLSALADRRMGQAMGAIHAEPARRWTLAELAGLAGMSRSVFALRFKAVVGTSPIDYLTRWRMALASDRLTAEPVAQVALSLGYESESAFSTAFKRVMGCSPRHYGRGEGKGLLSPSS